MITKSKNNLHLRLLMALGVFCLAINGKLGIPCCQKDEAIVFIKFNKNSKITNKIWFF
jgi:hypothetical protein